MLAVAISLLFALAGVFAIAAIAHTLSSQWAGVTQLVRTARDIRTERDFMVFHAAPERPAMASADLPRPRHGARGVIMRRLTVSPAPLRAAA